MKKLFLFSVLALFFIGVQDVWAKGDVGSRECGEAQDACLDAIESDDFKNHGKKVSACAKASNTDAGFDITDECHSCIVSQVARRIPLEEQENCGPEFVAATCDDLVTEIDMWGRPAKGIDLRAYTNSTLHWIGCPGDGCSPGDFFCEYDEGNETLSFGSNGGMSALRAVVDPGDALGDAMPTTFVGCCNAERPSDICNAPDANNNGVPIDAAKALCDALGYQNGSVTSINSNICPEPQAIAADGSDWTSDFIGSPGFGQDYTCIGFK